MQYSQRIGELHDRELALANPGPVYLGLAVLAVVGASFAVAWMVRDSNAERLARSTMPLQYCQRC